MEAFLSNPHTSGERSLAVSAWVGMGATATPAPDSSLSRSLEELAPGSSPRVLYLYPRNTEQLHPLGLAFLMQVLWGRPVCNMHAFLLPSSTKAAKLILADSLQTELPAVTQREARLLSNEPAGIHCLPLPSFLVLGRTVGQSAGTEHSHGLQGLQNLH